MGTKRMLSMQIIGLQSEPATPPCHTKNVNPVMVSLLVALAQAAPSCVLLNSHKGTDTVTH